MLNWHDPSSGIESLALHVTVVVATGNLSPEHHDIAWSDLTYNGGRRDRDHQQCHWLMAMVTM